MNNEALRARPTSPHLLIYRKQINTVLSVFHRLTGIMLFGVMAIALWSLILWIFTDFDDGYLYLINNKIFKAVFIFISFGYFLHLTTGIRHLLADMGYGFKIGSIHLSGWLAIISSIILTIMLWVML